MDDVTEPVSAEEARMALLIVGPGGGEVRELPRTGSVTVGRAPGCDVVIDEATISRKHAMFELGPTPRFRDLGSANGSRVASRRVVPFEPTPIALGQAVELGNVVVVLHRPRKKGLPPRPPESFRRSREGSDTIVVRDPSMTHLHAVVSRVAPSELSVLVLGETGVGKEIVAQAIHRQSRRATGPFVQLNCSAIAESLVEAELFGYVRGAFTGAHRDKPGLIEAADGGTLLLDEVGELSLRVQAKLLRVLEARRVKRVGGLESTPIDVRFIAATNRDLAARCDAGTFRVDLFYRLDGITLKVPPLRARRSEIAPLARRFAIAAAERTGGSAVLDDAVLARLEEHDWPGNVRELRNVIERASVLAGPDPISTAHLPPELVAAPSRAERESTLASEVAELERQRIIDALDRCSGNQTRAARLLGMPRRTFVKRLDTYDIPRPRKHRQAKGDR
jgi:DNA-binding NtrC family response regulator